MMKNYIFVFFLLFLLVFFINSCKNGYENANSVDSLKFFIDDTTIIGSIDKQTDENIRVLDQKQVLFFMPSPQERQELFKYYGYYNQYELQAVFNNFSNLSRNARSALQIKNIDCEVTYADKFVFYLDEDTIVLDLKLEKQIFGYILFDGINAPVVKYGVQRTIDVTNDIRNYFKMSDFSVH